jgi:hypothetical protein
MDRHPVVQDSFQEGVVAQFTCELDRYRPTADDLARLTGVAMAAPPCEQVTDDHQLCPGGASRAFAARHSHKGIGGVGIEALALPAGLVDGSSGALSSQLEAVDEGHSRLWRKSTAEADHPEPVAPTAERPGTQLLAMEVAYIGVRLAVLTGHVAQLAQVRAPCHLEQFGFSTWRLGLCLYNLGGLQQRQLSGQECRLGARAIGQASRCLKAWRAWPVVPPTWWAIQAAPSLKPRA